MPETPNYPCPVSLPLATRTLAIVRYFNFYLCICFIFVLFCFLIYHSPGNQAENFVSSPKMESGAQLLPILTKEKSLLLITRGIYYDPGTCQILLISNNNPVGLNPHSLHFLQRK